MGPRTHADDFADLEDRAHKDFDPEDDQQDFDDSESEGSQDDNDVAAGRTHYQSVGKSKLRTGEVAALGPSYHGSQVSRKNIDEQTEEHDPFTGYDSDEDDNEEEEDDGDDADEAGNDEEDDHDDDGSGTDDTSLSDEGTPSTSHDRAQLRSLMSDSRKSVAESIAAAATADATKGRAVKVQHQTFDSLLNSRIRLQHSLIASNTMAATPGTSEDDENKSVYEGAEAAALNLFKTLSSLRDALPSQKAGEKRKRPGMTASTPTPLLWSYLNHQDSTSRNHHRAVLQKWSQKTASATTTAAQSSNKLNPTAQTTLLDVLDSHLGPTSMPRHVERTKVARSCAPVQQKRPRPFRNSESTSGPADDEQSAEVNAIYDDADFYGVLLKELLEARNSNATVDYSIAASHAANGSVEDEYRAARQAKSHSRPGADRKASKGRKMRYTVHEKLQNFMAPEDRGSWEQRQREELFGSLFGRQLQLVEDDGPTGNGDAEEEALMLFRS